MTQTVTRSIEVDVEPDRLFAILADAGNIPEWAPDFADTIEHETGEAWRAAKGERVFSVRVAANPASRTVDYLREIARGREAGAFVRVLPAPAGGSVVVMTLPVVPGSDPRKVADVLGEELQRLAALAG